jgi:hypothetical protein
VGRLELDHRLKARGLDDSLRVIDTRIVRFARRPVTAVAAGAVDVQSRLLGRSNGPREKHGG